MADSNAGHLCSKTLLIVLIDGAGAEAQSGRLLEDKHVAYGLFWSVSIIELQGFPVIHRYRMKK